MNHPLDRAIQILDRAVETEPMFAEQAQILELDAQALAHMEAGTVPAPTIISRTEARERWGPLALARDG